MCAPPGPNFLEFAQVMSALDVWRQTLVWVKNSIVMGRSDYHYQHESIFYGWRPGAAHLEMPDRKQSTVWEFDRPTMSREHPTMKPIGLFEKAIRISSVPGDIVLDPFAGSGTSLLASAQMGRVARCIEISTAYCDVIVERFQQTTGEKATRGPK